MTLGVLLFAKGLEMDWKGEYTDLARRPPYARKMNLLLYHCPTTKVQCFFCKHGHTHGTNHRKKGQKHPSKRKALVSPVGYSDIPEQIKKNMSHCRLCYKRERENDLTAERSVIQQRCSKTYKGCCGCNNGEGLIVCDSCWGDYEHDI